jgi:transcriptional regulator of acetoin/glycerol metabolism
MEEFYSRQRKLWEDFMAAGMCQGVRPFILDSWIRCREYSRRKQFRINVLSDKELKNRVEQHRGLLDIAHSMMAKVFLLVETSQYVMTLHDKDSYIIDYIYNEKYYKPPRAFATGAQWTESLVGTNGVAMALHLNAPVQVRGPEHYREAQHGFTCSAAPIHDHNDELIGILNMTGPFEKSNPHTLGLVASTAFAIENQIALFYSYSMVKDTFDCINESIIVLDNNFRIQQANRNAARILKIKTEDLSRASFLDIFNPNDFKQRVFEGKAPFSYSEYDFKCGDTVVTCNVSVTPMLLHDKVTGIILLLRESGLINRMAVRISGNKSWYSFSDIITQDKTLMDIIASMKGVANMSCTILLQGESGTGKELFAHSIHTASARKNGPFIVVNCVSLPRSLVESELFGYERGAFTGALGEGSAGKFELANGGTIFLDEIGELPLEIQAKLLRVLDNHRVTRIGGKLEKALDIRVIAATNRDLYAEVQKHNFRDDLYFRINVMKFFIPPLRGRHGDIPLLVRHMIRELNNQNDVPEVKTASPEFIAALEQYHFPGNVRELQNMVARAYYINRTALLVPADLSNISSEAASSEDRYSGPGETGEPLPVFDVNGYERRIIEQALDQNGRNAKKAQFSLGMSKSTFYRKVKKFGILI